MTRQFISAFNGARDNYDLPLALEELGLLKAHISDLYCPDWSIPLLPRLPFKLARRRRDGLPSARVHIALKAGMQRLRGLPDTSDRHYKVDRELSLAAARLARRTDSDLFLHSFYAYWAFSECPDRRRWMYQFHPHGAYARTILEKDFEAFPEVRWSFENEEDSLPLERQRPESLQEWTLADVIFCASSFTRASLVAQGCQPDRVHVVPYGLPPHALRGDGFAPKRRDARAKAQFLFVGQGVQRKGLHHLLHAWRRMPTTEAELTVVARRIDPGIAALLATPGVTYLPGVSHDQLEALYAASDIFVMPSLIEGFGLVYLEALAQGLHCVGSVNTGLPDLGLDQRSISYVRSGQIDELAERLAECAQDVRAGRISKADIVASLTSQSSELRRSELRQAISSVLNSAAPA